MRAFDVIVWTFLVAASGLAAAIVVYALGSFFLMRRHTSARGVGISLRELAREAILAALTQPLLPFFYLYGYRMEPFGGRRARAPSVVPVVFVHGYMQNRVGFVGLGRALAQRGIGPLYGFNYPWFLSIESNARRLDRFVTRVCRETGSAAVDLVCHSMGGLVAMEMLRVEARKVRRCVTIATPHAGVAWRGPIVGLGATSLRRGSKLLAAHAGYALTLPTLSVFSSHDNVVYPKETSYLVERGGRDVEVEGPAHLAILFSPVVAERVASFLLEPGPAAAEAVETRQFAKQ
ncbi:MAG: alpha/beta fold hydrolase [Labilithrix sp.]|nr:alpha/beta fold hydrolase [Labilithrix sp.]